MPATSSTCARERKLPFSLRWLTIFSAVRSVIPATNRSSVHDEVFKSTPTLFTQLSITVSSDS